MHNKSYQACPKKLNARQATIIDAYRKLFNQQALPSSKQYWTLSATCVDEKGLPLVGAELDQLLKSGLIQPNQFVGIDINPNVIATNSKFTQATWYNDDILAAMNKHFCNGLNFNPGIVNCDFIGGPGTQSAKFANIIQFITNRDIMDVMVVGNFVMKSRYRQNIINPNSIVSELCKNKSFESSYPNGWKMEDYAYSYNGTGKSSPTQMTTVILWRK